MRRVQLSGHNDRHGGGRRGRCHHPVVRVADAASEPSETKPGDLTLNASHPVTDESVSRVDSGASHASQSRKEGSLSVSGPGQRVVALETGEHTENVRG